MKIRKIPLFLTVLVLFFAVPEALYGKGLLNRRSYGTSSFVKIEKAGFGDQARWVFSGDFFDQMDSLVHLPAVFIQNSSLADLYRAQPLLFGVVSVFLFAAIVALCFVVHLARSDSRFS